MVNYGFVAKLKRVIMEKENYRRQWLETKAARIARGGANAGESEQANVSAAPSSSE